MHHSRLAYDGSNNVATGILKQRAASKEVQLQIDELDARLIRLLSDEAGISIVECARRLGVARATAQSRLDKLRSRGVITSEAPSIDPAALGYPLRTYCIIQVRQTINHDVIAERLSRIPEMLDLDTITGDFDMMATVVSRSTVDLQRVLDLISNTDGILRVSTRLTLASHFRNRILPLVAQASEHIP